MVIIYFSYSRYILYVFTYDVNKFRECILTFTLPTNWFLKHKKITFQGLRKGWELIKYRKIPKMSPPPPKIRHPKIQPPLLLPNHRRKNPSENKPSQVWSLYLVISLKERCNFSDYEAPIMKIFCILHRVEYARRPVVFVWRL